MDRRLRKLVACGAMVFFAGLFGSACGRTAGSHEDTGKDSGPAADADADGDGDPGPGTDGGTDAGGGPEADAGADAAPGGPTVYPFGQRHSPVTEQLALQLRALAASNPDLADDRFAKVGDSNMASTSFAACFTGPYADLDGRTDLEGPLALFNGGDAAGATPFARVSLAARAGMRAGAVLSGTPSPLDQEIGAISPRFALVMLGTNDVGASDIFAFTRNIFAIVDALIAEGVVPVLFTIPPRDDSAADAETRDFNVATHGAAQARQVPLVDLDQELRALPGFGLSNDGFNLDVYVDGGTRGCVLTAEALSHGHNVQNLLALEALARASRALDALPAPDPAAVRPGDGTLAAPLAIDALPFVDFRNTAVDGESRLDAYPACDGASVDESGNELIYRFAVQSPTPVRILVVPLGAADVDLHLLSDPSDADSCGAGDDRQLDAALTPGTWWIAVDTTADGGVPKAGEYLLIALPE